MNRERLIEYFEMVMTMEINKINLSNAINAMEAIDCDAKLISELRMISSVKEIYSYKWNSKVSVSRSKTIGTLVGAIGFLVMFIVQPFENMALNALLGMAMILAFPCIGMWMDSRIAVKKKKAEEAALVKKENKERADRNKEIKEKNIIIQEEAVRKKEMVANAIQRFREVYKYTCELLDRMYSENIIYQKYRNIQALSYIYEYLDSKRCDTLEGPNGAYSIYETEVRLDTIITKLDEVISRLGRIVNKQSNLYHAIQRMQGDFTHFIEKIEEGTGKLDEIISNTEITAHASKIIESNQYYDRVWRE